MNKILVVDDEEEIIQVLKEFLKMKGYEVFTAQNGFAALEKINETRPSVVLLDIIMPGINGIDTLIKIKESDQNIGVVMMSALSDRELVKKALQLGAYDYIIKPFDLKYLDMVILNKIAELTSKLESVNQSSASKSFGPN